MGAGTLMMTVTPVVTTAVTTMCSHRFISNKPCGLRIQRSQVLATRQDHLNLSAGRKKSLRGQFR